MSSTSATKSNKWLIAAVVTIVVVILIGGGIGLFIYMSTPPTSKSRAKINPKDVMSHAGPVNDVTPTDEFTAGSFKNAKGDLLGDGDLIMITFDTTAADMCTDGTTATIKAWGSITKVTNSTVYVKWQILQNPKATALRDCTFERKGDPDFDLKYLGDDGVDPTYPSGLKSLVPIDLAKTTMSKEDAPKRDAIAPQKCCWNKSIKSCNSNSECDTGGEGCIATGSKTQKYGPVVCNVCKDKGMVYDVSYDKCIDPKNPPTIADRYYIVKGAFNGMDYKKLDPTPENLDQCLNACYSDGNCDVASFNQQSKECWLQQFTKDPTVNSYVGFDTGWSPFNGKRIDGNDISTEHQKLEQCKLVCKSNPKCQMITSNEAQSVCYLKGTNKDDTNRITAIKRVK